MWREPPFSNHLKMVITNNETGEKHNLAISDIGHITWFKSDNSGNLSIEERKTDKHTTMALEVNDTNTNLIKTTVEDPRKKTTKMTIENIY